MAIVLDGNSTYHDCKEWEELLERHKVLIQLPSGRMIDIRDPFKKG